MNRYKVVLLGASHTGKTSIVHRYVDGVFLVNTVTSTQAAFFQKKVDAVGTDVWIDIWDTAGQERFHALTPMFYRDAQGALIVFDLSDKNSFERAKQWVAELYQSRGDQCKMILVGNKADLASIRAVETETAKQYAASQKFDYFECSAKTGQNIDKVFIQLAQSLSSGGSNSTGTSSGLTRKRTSVRLDEPVAPASSSGGCC